MTIKIECKCGRTLRARNEFAGKRAHCPTCGNTLIVPETPAEPDQDDLRKKTNRPPLRPDPMEITEFLDPPAATPPAAKPNPEKPPVLRRMFETLLDPKSIQWMLMLGGGLLVLGLIVLLINWLDLEAPFIIATSMGAGTLAVMGLGWFMTLKTKFKNAGRALTFLACVVAPLNLWYYHAQDLLTLENHLWIGGVVCSLFYIATVRILRDPLFMYAVEAGVTLTVLLFLPILDVSVDATALSVCLIALGAISIHVERAFPESNSEFPRQKYGMPLFWSGQAQTAVALIILFGSQTLGWMNDLIRDLYGSGFQGNLLSTNSLLAGGLWLAGAYLYLYSDLVVRRVGYYIYVAAFSLLMAIITLVGWQLDSLEAVIIVMSVIALIANLAKSKVSDENKQFIRVSAPLGLILSGIPLLIGWGLYLRANNPLWGSSVSIEWIYVAAMLVVTVSNRISAHLFRHEKIGLSTTYLFFSAAGLLLSAAGMLPLLGLTDWYQQAPALILIPIGYIIASRLWRGHTLERPLGSIAHTATAMILFHVFIASVQEFGIVFRPLQDQIQNLLLGVVFAEAALFYSLAGLFRKRSANAYFAAIAACGAMWQWLGYFEIPGHYHTILYAVLGLVALVLARSLGLESVAIYGPDGDEKRAIQGRGLTAFQSGNAILSIALLSAFWQGFADLIQGSGDWMIRAVLIMTTGISIAAIGIVPKGTWKRVYGAAAAALAGLTLLTFGIEWLKVFTFWEKVELVSILTGICLLVSGYVGRFRETEGSRHDSIDVALFFGSILATAPLIIAVIYHRWWGDSISFYDELGTILVTTLMLVTGFSWQSKAPTLFGGSCLTLYLIIMITEIAKRAEELMGVAIFMTIIGGIVFALGIALSMYRDKLLELPDKIANREGLFRILSWR